MRGVKAPSASEHQKIRQRVAAQPVCAVEPRGYFACGEKPRHGGGRTIGVNANTAHTVVAGGSDIHGFFGDIHVGEFFELMVHRRQSPRDVFRRPARRNIEVDAAMLGAAAGFHFSIDRPGYLIAG